MKVTLLKLFDTNVKRWIWICGVAVLLLLNVFYIFSKMAPPAEFEISDSLGGNIFPSAIISTATTDYCITPPIDSMYVGNPNSSIYMKIRSRAPHTRVRVEIEETQFSKKSVSEFVLPLNKRDYIVYPEIIWDYAALRNNQMASPVTFSVKVTLNGKDLGQDTRTFSVRGINECLLGFTDKANKFHSTDLLFAAYVNEENPLIDNILREALDTRIVNRFLGYQRNSNGSVDKQVYALWNVLQKRNFRYSSVSYSSLSSNVVLSQRVRTFDDSFQSSQINCVDGSVLFASLLRAINIDPVLVRIPGHMFVGYYTDKNHKNINYLETTMIGDVDLDDFFPEEKFDSTTVGKSRNEMSLFTFEKSQEYARSKFEQYKGKMANGDRYFMFLNISKAIRRKVQPIGK